MGRHSLIYFADDLALVRAGGRGAVVQEHLDGDFNDGDRSILRRPGADLLLAPSRSNWSARGTVVPE